MIFFLCFSGTKTIENQHDAIQASIPNEQWLKVALGINKPENFFIDNNERLSLSDTSIVIVLNRIKTDLLGNKHYYYKQFYKGVPIEASTLMVHENKGVAKIINGKFYKDININTIATFPKEAALQVAIKNSAAEMYAWESDSLEKEIKVINNNESATFLPEGKLVILYLDNKFRLSYKYDVYTIKPYDRRLIYIDAKTGELISNHSMGFKSTGTVNTLFNGSKNFTTEYRGFPFFNFILKDETRGYICTKDYADWAASWFGWGAADHVADHDDVWNNDIYRRTYATAQWAGEMVYDYFKDEHDRYGIGGNNNVDLRIAVYAGEDATGWYPDYASSDVLVLGNDSDKDSIFYEQVALDIIGHEFTHGVICNETDIEYEFSENGAIIESFCDIFGTMVEKYVEGTSADWKYSEDAYGTFYPRDLSDPFHAQQPKTRGGTYWLNPSICPGVGSEWYCTELLPYTNMGVQNYWFYLLSEGGSNNGVTVGSIGTQKAAKIAYYTMCYYFDSNSDFDDVRNGSIESAETLFGACSDEYKQVMNSWAAVGVGDPAPDPCISSVISGPSTVCPSSTEFTITDLPSGFTISWTCSQNITRISNQGSNPCQFEANASGENGWINATISYNGNQYGLGQKNVWVGSDLPYPVNIEMTGENYELVEHTNDYWEVCPNTIYRVVAHTLSYPSITQWDWTIPESWELLSNENSPEIMVQTGEYIVWEDEVRVDVYNYACDTWIYYADYLLVTEPPFGCGESLQFNLFPNPAKTSLTIQISEDENYKESSPNYRIAIMDQSGRVTLNKITKGNLHHFDISNLKDGEYTVIISLGKKIRSQKFIKSN
jgi:Zn-dependent metalloprotease